MMAMKTPRCPSCGHPAKRPGGEPVLPGMLLVCAGCLVPSRFDDAGERLVAMEPGDLPGHLAERVAETQRQLREKHSPLGRPPGYRWRSMALCRPCWDELEAKEPGVAQGLPRSHCAFCGLLTDSGIYRRLLVKDERFDNLSPRLPGFGKAGTN